MHKNVFSILYTKFTSQFDVLFFFLFLAMVCALSIVLRVFFSSFSPILTDTNWFAKPISYKFVYTQSLEKLFFFSFRVTQLLAPNTSNSNLTEKRRSQRWRWRWRQMKSNEKEKNEDEFRSAVHDFDLRRKCRWKKSNNFRTNRLLNDDLLCLRRISASKTQRKYSFSFEMWPQARIKISNLNSLVHSAESGVWCEWEFSPLWFHADRRRRYRNTHTHIHYTLFYFMKKKSLNRQTTATAPIRFRNGYSNMLGTCDAKRHIDIIPVHFIGWNFDLELRAFLRVNWIYVKRLVLDFRNNSL